jgi:hypothetical protein
MKAATPEIGTVLRFSGASSGGGTHRKGGRGAKSARRFGGSLSVIAMGNHSSDANSTRNMILFAP